LHPLFKSITGWLGEEIKARLNAFEGTKWLKVNFDKIVHFWPQS
jgi:hypothetical protein